MDPSYKGRIELGSVHPANCPPLRSYNFVHSNTCTQKILLHQNRWLISAATSLLLNPTATGRRLQRVEASLSARACPLRQPPSRRSSNPNAGGKKIPPHSTPPPPASPAAFSPHLPSHIHRRRPPSTAEGAAGDQMGAGSASGSGRRTLVSARIRTRQSEGPLLGVAREQRGEPEAAAMPCGARRRPQCAGCRCRCLATRGRGGGCRRSRRAGPPSLNRAVPSSPPSPPCDVRPRLGRRRSWRAGPPSPSDEAAAAASPPNTATSVVLSPKGATISRPPGR